MVAEQHLGVPVKCGRCGLSFTTRVDAPTRPVRLDIGAASSPGRAEDDFFAQHLIYCHLDERHELAVLAISGDRRFDAATTLGPLLSNFLTGAKPDAAGVAESIAAACKNQSAPAAIAVIWEGKVSIGSVGEKPIYYQSVGRLTRLQRDPVKLTAGDWLVLTGGDSQSPPDESALQREIAAVSPSATALAERLVQGGSRTILAARCY